MDVVLGEHQLKAVNNLANGKILHGDTGVGKSRTAITYYYIRECGGSIVDGHLGEMKHPKDLYIITTAKKRNTGEWAEEVAHFGLSEGLEGVCETSRIVVDSWNNIKKFEAVRGAFFVFDEQRLVGSGAWVKAFYKIAKNNHWILLTATPGDTWSDYIPVFVANGFYKNKTEFVNRHCIYSRYTKYPKIDDYRGQAYLEKLRDQLLVEMPYLKTTTKHRIMIPVEYNDVLFKQTLKTRKNFDTGKPIRNSSELVYLLRKITNFNASRFAATQKLVDEHPRTIIFYNFDYELEMLRALVGRPIFECNGHQHDDLPEGSEWVYLVQYMSGSEGWNCTTTDTIIFFSLHYSYRTVLQAEGRIDRLNTPFEDLWYYTLRSYSKIDGAIMKALKAKKTFNERSFVAKFG